MFSKIPATYWKVLGVVFTSILAPLGLRHFDDTSSEKPVPDSNSQPAPIVAAQELSPGATRIVAHGAGSNAEAAFQNAIDSALQQAIAAELSATDWNKHGQSYLTTLRRNGDGILRGWREVSSTSEHHLTGRVFHSEVSVEVDVKALRALLHPGHMATQP